MFSIVCMQVSPMSVYGCLGSEEDGHSIRDGYVMRLDARTEVSRTKWQAEALYSSSCQ